MVKSEGGTGGYWISAFSKSDWQQFNPYSSSYTPPANNNIKKYWEDESYIEVSEPYAIKVYYGSLWLWSLHTGEWINPYDHSAVRITSGANAGKYESKWGSWGRYIHSADKCPYELGRRQYYMKYPSISGFALVPCSGSSSFSIPEGSTSISWSVPSGLQIVSGQGTRTVVISKSSSGTSPSATISVACTYGGNTYNLSTIVSLVFYR